MFYNSNCNIKVIMETTEKACMLPAESRRLKRGEVKQEFSFTDREGKKRQI